MKDTKSRSKTKKRRPAAKGAAKQAPKRKSGARGKPLKRPRLVAGNSKDADATAVTGLEDLRELWVWGRWKEPALHPLSSSVFVVCTSRDGVRRYVANQTHDYALHGVPDPGPRPDEDLFDDGTRQYDGRKRFRLLGFDAFVEELANAARPLRDDAQGLTLLINPRRAAGERTSADVMVRADEWLKEVQRAR